mgnify:CR=1 FL=1
MFQFLQDLYSGKLHREFHYGKDEEKQDSSSDSTPDKIEVFIIQPILTHYNIKKQFGQISKPPNIQFTFYVFRLIEKPVSDFHQEILTQHPHHLNSQT